MKGIFRRMANVYLHKDDIQLYKCSLKQEYKERIYYYKNNSLATRLIRRNKNR